MPHTRAHSWAALERVEPPAAASWFKKSSVALFGKGGGGSNSYNSHDNAHVDHQRRASQPHMRTRSIPAVTSTDKYAPVPFARPKEKKQVSITVKPARAGNRNMTAKPLAIKPPSPVCWLPCMPTSTYNPRNELQRRASPTTIHFGPTFPASPPLTPLTPAGAQTFLTANTELRTPLFGSMEDEPVYVLTLRTSGDIAQRMQALRQKWFPPERLKVSAHVTLFHALPGSRLDQIEDHIFELTRRTPSFEISTGRVMRMRQGVLVNLRAGDSEVRHLYGDMRSAFFEWLSEQDKSCKAHWTIQNKEENSKRVDDAFEDTAYNGTSYGWATGLVLWRYGDDGRWQREKEYDFAESDSRRSVSR